MKLNKEIIMQENTVVHIPNNDMAQKIIEILKEEFDHDYSYLSVKGEACINIKNRSWQYREYYANKNYTILTIDDIIIKEQEEPEILVADFSNARVGDRVKCLSLGAGIINSFSEGCIVVVHSSDFKVQHFYNIDGSTYRNDNYKTQPTLFYHFEGQFPTKEACFRPLPDIEVDEKVLVWDCIKLDWVPMHFSKHVIDGINVWEYGKTSFTTSISSHCYRFWKLYEDESINSGNLHEIENND